VTYLLSKASLRRQAALLVSALGSEQRRHAEAAVCDHVASLAAYQAAEQLIAYMPLADELDIEGLLARASADGKRLFLPVAADDGTLVFRSWARGEDLETGAFGVRVPRHGDAPLARRSLSVIPGRAFDRRGYRVGRGKGCYDRVLRGLSQLGPTLGVAYACQVFASVPRQRHDQAVDLLVTEQGCIHEQWPRGS